MSRRSRVQQVADNREAILDAAQRHFSQLGYHGASLDAISDAAGFSKGAIYSQFGSKDDLMLAVLERNIERRRDSGVAMLDALGAELRRQDVLRHFEAGNRADPGWQSALVEFRIHVSRTPTLNDRYRALHDVTVEALTDTCVEIAERLAIDPRISPRTLALALLMGGTGMAVEAHVTDVPDVVEFARAMAALAPGIDERIEP